MWAIDSGELASQCERPLFCRNIERMKKEIMATYIGDSKHYHLFHIEGGQRFMGTIYVPKDEPTPRILTIRLRTKDEDEG